MKPSPSSVLCLLSSIIRPLPSVLLPHLEHLNWESFVKTAQEEKLLPLLYYACKQKSIVHLLPASVVATLQSAYINNLGRTFFLKKALSEVLKAFNDQQVKIMLLKGGALLVETVYPDINTRMMSDIDFMVHPEDIAQVKRIFQDLDYTCIPDPWGETVKMNFIKDQFDFELHTRPFSELLIPILPPEEMWEKAEKKRYGDSLVYLPSPDDLLYHCIFHELIQHDHLFDIPLANLYEVDLILKAFRKNIDLLALFHRAKHYRLEVHFSFFLRELENIFRSPLPCKVKEWIDDIVNQFNPFYHRVCQLPGFLKKAGQRFFNFSILYELHRNNLKNYYSYYIEPILYSPADKILSYYGLSPSYRLTAFLLRAIDIVKALLLHMVVRYFYLNENAMNLSGCYSSH